MSSSNGSPVKKSTISQEEQTQFLSDVITYVKGEKLLARIEDKIDKLDELQEKLELRLIDGLDKRDNDYISINSGKNKFLRFTKKTKIKYGQITEDIVREAVYNALGLWSELDDIRKTIIDDVISEINDIRDKKRIVYLEQTIEEGNENKSDDDK